MAGGAKCDILILIFWDDMFMNNVTAWIEKLKNIFLKSISPDTVAIIIIVAIFYHFLNKWYNSD
ncbi:hypothetical protein BMS3Bbin06_00151 [bacterium BMS3Bbin06]|nr:hypothetical protein BMS3Abin08_00243 [bacterium BMS3Abin08]GBE33641.1 hypothetical protein BMS3Bbin06_00151 [bacterium BMS3Bbin06]